MQHTVPSRCSAAQHRRLRVSHAAGTRTPRACRVLPPPHPAARVDWEPCGRSPSRNMGRVGLDKRQPSAGVADRALTATHKTSRGNNRGTQATPIPPDCSRHTLAPESTRTNAIAHGTARTFGQCLPRPTTYDRPDDPRANHSWLLAHCVCTTLASALPGADNAWG